jgi:multicomponent Na+:H+ antiporter subunit C
LNHQDKIFPEGVTVTELEPRIYLLAGAALFAVGVYGLIIQTHFLKKILALNVMGNGVFLIFITFAALAPGNVPDPVPHAMVLTGIVVAVCATGLGLVLADRVQKTSEQTAIDEKDRE